MKIQNILLLLFSISSLSHAQAIYQVENGWIIGVNIDKYNNRPLYLHNTNAFILCGDKPIARFAKDDYLY